MPETVSVLSESLVLLPVAPGITKPMKALTYAAFGIPFRIVYIDPAKDTPDERKRAIADDLRAARQAVPQTLELP